MNEARSEEGVKSKFMTFPLSREPPSGPFPRFSFKHYHELQGHGMTCISDLSELRRFLAAILCLRTSDVRLGT